MGVPQYVWLTGVYGMSALYMCVYHPTAQQYQAFCEAKRGQMHAVMHHQHLSRATAICSPARVCLVTTLHGLLGKASGHPAPAGGRPSARAPQNVAPRPHPKQAAWCLLPVLLPAHTSQHACTVMHCCNNPTQNACALRPLAMQYSQVAALISTVSIGIHGQSQIVEVSSVTL